MQHLQPNTTLQGGKYKIERVLGQGGFGNPYVGYNTEFEEQREKFKKEARRLRKLKNEHIVKVHDLFEENGTAYYVMDYKSSRGDR